MNIFADKLRLPAGRPHTIMLYPFWGTNLENREDPVSGRFDRYLQEGKRLFALTPLDQAEVVVVPHEWVAGDANAAARQAIDEAGKAGKQAALFFNHDSEEDIDVENTLVFRTSFRRSRRKANEFAFMVWSEDFVERYLGGDLVMRKKGPKPVVGYCGYAALGQVRQERLVGSLRKVRGASRVLNRLKIGIDGTVGMRLRSEAVARLAASRQVETNFLLRRAFWNGAAAGDFTGMEQSRREFVQNMVGSDYILCIRGAGNFSYRLYETLCCGRIPVFVDTDCVLPYERWIDWRRHCVWVKEKDLPHIAERVAEFHGRLTEQEFEDRQRACREVWEEWLSPVGYFENFYRHFE